METSGRIWPNFELIQALMHVLITCKYEKDPSKNGGENVMTSFSPLYRLFKKKRKHYIIFNNLRTFIDEHFKLASDLHWHVPYQKDEFHNFSGTITLSIPSSCKGTHETKSHKNSM